MERKMRRSERSIDKVEAYSILNKGEYGILSTVGVDGLPYGVPISYAVLDEMVVFHCAKEGHKLENLEFQPKVCFTVVGDTLVVPEGFTTHFESVIVKGVAAELHDTEKQEALVALINKYSKGFESEGLNYIQRAGGKTKVFGISIDAISGKKR